MDCAGEDEVRPAEKGGKLSERMRAYTEALLRGDPDEVRAFWVADPRVLLPGLDLDGPGLTRFVDEFFGGGGRVASVEFDRYDVFVHDGAAYELGSYEETAEVGDEIETVEGNYFLRWVRSADGEWRIDRFVGGPVAPPE